MYIEKEYLTTLRMVTIRTSISIEDQSEQGGDRSGRGVGDGSLSEIDLKCDEPSIPAGNKSAETSRGCTEERTEGTQDNTPESETSEGATLQEHYIHTHL